MTIRTDPQIVAVEWSTDQGTKATLRFFCARCNEWVEYLYSSRGPAWPEFRELAQKSALQHHDESCPPRRGQYRQALGVALRIKPR